MRLLRVKRHMARISGEVEAVYSRSPRNRASVIKPSGYMTSWILLSLRPSRCTADKIFAVLWLESVCGADTRGWSRGSTTGMLHSSSGTLSWFSWGCR